MKDSIGGIFLFNIVILFVLLFTGIMTITINRTKAFNTKDEVINIIEKNNGIDIYKAIGDGYSNKVFEDIFEATNEVGYRATGICPKGYEGFDRDGKNVSKNPSMCLKKQIVNSSDSLNGVSPDNHIESEVQSGCYYSVILFYNIAVPVLKDVMNFNVRGETKILYNKEICG